MSLVMYCIKEQYYWIGCTIIGKEKVPHFLRLGVMGSGPLISENRPCWMVDVSQNGCFIGMQRFFQCEGETAGFPSWLHYLTVSSWQDCNLSLPQFLIFRMKIIIVIKNIKLTCVKF